LRGGGTPQTLSEISHPALPSLFTRFGLHSALVAPMHCDGQVVGTLSLVRGGRRPPFDADDERVVQDLADRAGLAVQNALLHQELSDRALTDPLTGLPNRHLFLEQLGLALRRLGRHPGTVAVVFMDLDDFKAVNDAIGHDAGDQVLVHVAAQLRAVLRTTDTAGRLGGDEFVAVCPDLADTAAARVIAERLTQAISTTAALARAHAASTRQCRRRRHRRPAHRPRAAAAPGRHGHVRVQTPRPRRRARLR